MMASFVRVRETLMDSFQLLLNLSTDINECELIPSRCDERANCTNYPGLYECTCINGFSGSGKPGKCTGETVNETLFQLDFIRLCRYSSSVGHLRERK